MSEEENVIKVGQNKAQESKVDKISQIIDNPEVPKHILSQMVDTEFPAIVDEVELPSKGIFYNSKQATVKVKHLTAEDENILTSPDLIRSGKVLDVLLENAIIDNSLSAEDMLIGDRNAVLLFLRKEGYGDDYPVRMSCPKCNESFVESVLISSLETKELTTMPDQSGLFAVTLPKTKWQIKFRLMNGADESFLSKKAEMPKKTKKNISYSQLLTERYILQIMEVNGNSDKLYIKKAVTNMPISDSLVLREYIRMVEPGVDMEHEFTCTNCGNVFLETTPIQANLFWPNAKI